MPELRQPKDPLTTNGLASDATSVRASTWQVAPKHFLAPLADLKRYCQHSAFLPSLSLSLLYFTVLNMSGQQITYLISTGYSSIVIGLVRALSTVFELSATWSAPQVMRMIGAARAGMWFLSWQVAWLGGAVGLFWIDIEPTTAAFCLVTGTIMSRIGLWGYDISAQTIIQQVCIIQTCLF